MDKTTWDKVQGNLYRLNLNPKMLKDEGYITVINGAIYGEPKRLTRELEVIYDREYARQYVNRKIIQRLAFPNYNELQKFIAECWRER